MPISCTHKDKWEGGGPPAFMFAKITFVLPASQTALSSEAFTSFRAAWE